MLSQLTTEKLKHLAQLWIQSSCFVAEWQKIWTLLIYLHHRSAETPAWQTLVPWRGCTPPDKRRYLWLPHAPERHPFPVSWTYSRFISAQLLSPCGVNQVIPQTKQVVIKYPAAVCFIFTYNFLPSPCVHWHEGGANVCMSAGVNVFTSNMLLIQKHEYMSIFYCFAWKPKTEHVKTKAAMSLNFLVVFMNYRSCYSESTNWGFLNQNWVSCKSSQSSPIHYVT